MKRWSLLTTPWISVRFVSCSDQQKAGEITVSQFPACTSRGLMDSVHVSGPCYCHKHRPGMAFLRMRDRTEPDSVVSAKAATDQPTASRPPHLWENPLYIGRDTCSTHSCLQRPEFNSEEGNHLAKPTDSESIINAYCFKLLNLGVMRYTGIPNWHVSIRTGLHLFLYHLLLG